MQLPRVASYRCIEVRHHETVTVSVSEKTQRSKGPKTPRHNVLQGSEGSFHSWMGVEIKTSSVGNYRKCNK